MATLPSVKRNVISFGADGEDPLLVGFDMIINDHFTSPGMYVDSRYTYSTFRPKYSRNFQSWYTPRRLPAKPLPRTPFQALSIYLPESIDHLYGKVTAMRETGQTTAEIRFYPDLGQLFDQWLALQLDRNRASKENLFTFSNAFWSDADGWVEEGEDSVSGSDGLTYNSLLPMVFLPSTSALLPTEVIPVRSSRYTDARAMAYSNLVKRIAAGEVNIGVFAAELPETYRWLATMLYRLLTCVRKAWRGDFPGALKALRATGSRKVRRKANKLAGVDDFVLEFNYAFSPLMSDIYGFIQAVTDGIRTKGELIHVHASAATSDLIRNYVGWTLRREEKGVSRIQPTFCPDHEDQCMVKYDVCFRVVDPTLRTLQELGLLNPAEIIWEKIPFSFLIDWILNVNSIMASITAGAGLEFVDGTITINSLVPIRPSHPDLEQVFGDEVAAQALGFGGEGVETFREVTLPNHLGSYLYSEREVLTSLDPSEIRFDTIRASVNPFSSWTRISNFIALASKALQK